jgi:type II restriction enzyme
VKRSIISDAAIERRRYWVSEIVKISGDFGQDASRVEKELVDEERASGYCAMIDHLRLCGAIPEGYGHDTSEEKLYSKYTDALLAVCFRLVGLKSIVLTERADAADVEAFAEDYSFVADAKSFRLSRTAKNQKDFKVQAVDGWKRGKPYAIVVCPLYQLPSKTSQIYQQAIARDVCLFSYSHLAVLVEFANTVGEESAIRLLRSILECVSTLNPSKNALSYWAAINSTFLSHDSKIRDLWRTEKIASLETLELAKEEALMFLAEERELIMRMSHQEALAALVRAKNIDNRERVVRSITQNGLMDHGE